MTTIPLWNQLKGLVCIANIGRQRSVKKNHTLTHQGVFPEAFLFDGVWGGLLLSTDGDATVIIKHFGLGNPETNIKYETQAMKWTLDYFFKSV